MHDPHNYNEHMLHAASIWSDRRRPRFLAMVSKAFVRVQLIPVVKESSRARDGGLKATTC